MVCGPKTPDVSMATGVKACVGLRWAYLAVFLSSARAATAVAVAVAALAEERKTAKYAHLNSTLLS